MAVVNQQLEDDNNHGSGGSKRPVDEIARVNFRFRSKEAQKEEAIRQYLECMSRVIRLNQSEDDNDHIAGERASSIGELARISASTESEAGRVIGLCKETLWPIISATIIANQEQILSVIKEKSGLDLLRGMTWNSGNTASTSESQVFQFRFLYGISTPVFTSCNIEGKDGKPLAVALFDQSSGQIVTTGAEAATKIEIVVLEGDCKDVEAENWTSNEFNNSIISEWSGKKVLQGNTFLKLKEGIVYVDKISLTHNSTWKGKRNCRLGARSVDAVFATRVKEAKTECFPVMDKRNLKYNKHAIPSLSDDVYRLYGINWRSACYKRLKEANIKTVMDLRTLNAINPERLKDILKVHPHQWRIIMEHAQKCKDDKGIYLYHNSRDYQKRDGVVFNVSGHLVGLLADSQFIPWQMLSSNKKVDAQKVVVSASEHWNEVVPFNDEASLISRLQSGTPLVSFRNGLNLVIPDTSLITPISSTSQNKRKHDSVGDVLPTGQSSQNPKRPASEHAISNSSKKPRDNHLFTPNICTSRILTNTNATSEFGDGDEYLQYLNFPELDIVPGQKWKRVWCVVGCISVFIKICKRQMTEDNNTFIAASMEHVQI